MLLHGRCYGTFNKDKAGIVRIWFRSFAFSTRQQHPAAAKPKKMHCNFSKPSGKLSLSFYPGTVKRKTKRKGSRKKKARKKTEEEKLQNKTTKKRWSGPEKWGGTMVLRARLQKLRGVNFFRRLQPLTKNGEKTGKNGPCSISARLKRSQAEQPPRHSHKKKASNNNHRQWMATWRNSSHSHKQGGKPENEAGHVISKRSSTSELAAEHRARRQQWSTNGTTSVELVKTTCEL